MGGNEVGDWLDGDKFSKGRIRVGLGSTSLPHVLGGA